MKLITATVTAAVCICFVTLGAYAKSGRNVLPDENIQNSGASTEADLPDGNTRNYSASAKADLPDGNTRNNSASAKADLPDGNTRNYSASGKADFGADSTMTTPKKPALSIVHESADILFYEDGSPYIHDVLTNLTDRAITETEYCMLSFSADGQPLELKWNFLDSSANESYDCLISTGGLNILSNETENYQGGWSLEKDTAAKMAYNIFCLKKVVFEDGTVWENPEYESWHATYAGNEIDVEDLGNYYPHTYFIP